MHFLNRFRRAYCVSGERNDYYEVSMSCMTRGLRLAVVDTQARDNGTKHGGDSPKK